MLLLLLIFHYVAIIFITISVALGGNVPVENSCPTAVSGHIHGFRVDHCNAFPCVIIRERKYTAEFSFSPVKNSKNLRIKCGTYLWNQPQTLRDVNVCDHLSEGSCPFVAGQNYTYLTTAQVPYWVPPAVYYISCQLVDPNVGDQQIMCGTGSVRVA